MSQLREMYGKHILPTTKVLLEIESERHQQLTREGWTDEHDDKHELGEMAEAAACYASYSTRNYSIAPMPNAWPWDMSWWKPKNPRRDLIRAAALIVAEIERLDRAEDSPK